MSDRADAYAAALFEVAKAEGALERVEAELYTVARTVESSDELRNAMGEQGIPADRRQAVVEQLLGAKASPVTTALVSFVVGAGRGRELPAIVDKLVEISAAERSEQVAEVRVAAPLDDDQRRRLEEALSTATGTKVTAKIVVDPSVLGGVIARVGDTVIDGSVRNRLVQLKTLSR